MTAAAATATRRSAEPAADSFPPWRPVSSMPKDRIVLAKIGFREGQAVVSCQYEEVHGGWMLLPISTSGHNYAPVFPLGWMDCPPLTPNLRG